MHLVAVLLPFSFFFITHAKVVQIQVIHRHGARQVIDKHPTDPRVENQRPSLYPQGVEQLKRLGSHCRDQYLDGSSSSFIAGISPDSPVEGEIISRTSNFQRTQLSARAFLSALYPDHHEEIPTLVFNGTETDWIIRGYALCPTLHHRFLEFVKTDSEYKKQKETNEAFVTGLAKTLGLQDEDTKFENVFNVYDEYNILHSGYDGTEKYKDIAKLSDSEMNKLSNVANWYESHKYSFDTHEVHVGGGLLARIVQYARDIKKGSSYRIVHFSAHYPTLLTLLGSIRSQNEGDVEWPADRIPEFGAALIIEVHEEDDGELWLHMKWFQGGDDEGEVKSPPKPVAIGHADCKNPEKGCKLSSVERLLAIDTFREENFCRDCQSTSGVCEFLKPSSSFGTKVTSGAIGGAIGLAIGLLLSFMYFLCVSKRKQMGRASVHDFESSPYDGNVYA